MALRIKNWARFQHFKDRKPPWIKLYRDLLDDINWHELDPESAKMLISLWLIASEDETKSGLLPSTKELSFRLRISERSIKSNISKLGNWVYQDDIKTISDITAISTGYQENRLETETYKEEAETDISATPVNGVAVAYLPLADGSEFGVSKDLLAELEAAYPAVDGLATLKEIRAWCITNPTKRKTKRGTPAFLNRWFEKVQNHG